MAISKVAQLDLVNDFEQEVSFKKVVDILVPNGEAPLVIVSRTMVANLNAELFGGRPTTDFANKIHTHKATDISGIAFPVTSVAGRTGAVVLNKNDVGLGRVENRAFVWSWGSGTPTHIWGSSGDSDTQHVYEPSQVSVGRATNATNAQTATRAQYATTGNSLSTASLRNCIISPNNPSGGASGDIWFQY